MLGDEKALELDRFKAIVVEILGVDITPQKWTAPLEMISGWDSVSQLEVIFAVEAAFDVTLTEAEIESLTSLETLYNLIATKTHI